MSSTRDSGHAPPTPTCVADLETVIIAEGRTRQKAHIPAQHSHEPAPICGSGYGGKTTWREKQTLVYGDPDQWLTLCERCLTELDQEEDDA